MLLNLSIVGGRAPERGDGALQALARRRLFQVEQLFDAVVQPHYVGGSLGRPFELGFGVIEHACAETHAAVVALEYVKVHTSLAALPEFLVVGEFGECHGSVAHAAVQLHDGQRCGDAENFGKRKSETCEFKCLFLDASRQPEMAVVGVDYESGCGNKITVSPAFYVAEAYELVAVKGYYCLASGYFCRNIIGRTACYTCAALKSRLINQLANLL